MFLAEAAKNNAVAGMIIFSAFVLFGGGIFLYNVSGLKGLHKVVSGLVLVTLCMAFVLTGAFVLLN